MKDSVKKTNSVSKRTIITYSIIILIALSIGTLHFRIVNIQKSDGLRINLAGRQRMLTQKMTKEVLQYSTNLTKKEELEKTINVFETTLNSLLHGGAAPLDLEFKEQTTLPPMEKSATTSQLLKITKLWGLFKVNIHTLISENDSTAFKYILDNNGYILDEMDKAVLMMQNTSEENNRNINRILYIIQTLIILFMAILLGAKFYQLKHASVYIQRLESILPICSSCKKIREPNSQPEEKKSWTAIEAYIGNRSSSKFSHSLCPTCEEEIYGDQKWYIDMKKAKKDKAISDR